ncbi:MAG: histidine phosphatase family protein [Planctomycetota bacterium]
MTRPMLTCFAVLTLTPLLVAQPATQPAADAEPMSPGEQANADFVNKLDDAALVEALRAGGHVVYIRHAQTEKDYADQVTADVHDGSTQRVLSEEGWHQAKAIGAGFRALEIPVGDVISSEYFRAWQTADLAFGRYEKNAALNFFPAEDYTDEQFAVMRERVMPLMVAVPEDGVNTVIVGHDDPFEAVTGIYPDPQGVAYVVKPTGDSYELLARVPSEIWTDLAEAFGKDSP